MNTQKKTLKQKLFSKKVMGVPAFLIVLAVMSVGGMAVIASYGTSVATITVTQGISFDNATIALNAVVPGTQEYIITITNAGNMPATANLNGVVSETNDGIATSEPVTIGYSPINPTVPANGNVQVTATVTFGQTANPITYYATTTITP